MERKGARGFTLIELLITVCILGIISAIAIPNLLNAIDRSKQKSTMGEMRSIATAIESYAIDITTFPTATTMAALITAIDPMFIRDLPDEDGWGYPFVVDSNGTAYTLGSQGKDGAGGLSTCSAAPKCDALNDAIIFSNGQFVQWPEGTQH